MTNPHLTDFAHEIRILLAL